MEGYRKYLSRYGHTVSVKENKKRAAERMERYADGRKEQKEDFKNEIREYRGEYPSEFVDGKVTSLGINPDSTALVYELSYKMDNLVKRAGNNVILSLGKLFCDQLSSCFRQTANVMLMLISAHPASTLRVSVWIFRRDIL